MAIVIQFLMADGKCIDHALQDKIVIGRSKKTNLLIEDAKISSRHCSLELTKDNTVLFKDLESTNGSYVDHIKLTEHFLKIGEKIRIGSTSISIDESKLTPMERLSIGKASTIKQLKEEPLTLPDVQNTKTKSAMSVVRAKNPAEKAKKEKEVFTTGKDRMLEQEDDDNDFQLKLDKPVRKKA